MAFGVARERRRGARAHRLDDGGGEPASLGQPRMGIELVLRLEMPADEADRQFREILAARC